MGEVYTAGDVAVTLAGLFDVNPTAIEYGYEYDHKLVYGIKREPKGWSMGKKDMSSKITLPLDVVALFEKAAPNGDVAKLRPFTIVVVVANAENELIVDYITAKFKGNKRTVTGDGELENEFDLLTLDVKLNVGI
jgi:hypothetical protein